MIKNFIRIGELFDKYVVQLPISDKCIIITGPNNSMKTKTLELTRGYLLNSGENVVYFGFDRKLEFTMKDIKEAYELLESHAVLNKITGESYDLRLFKKWNLNLDMLEMDLKWQYGEWITSGFVQVVNFITKIIKTGPNAVVMIDLPEKNLGYMIKYTFLKDLLNLPNVKQLIIVTHCLELIEDLRENTWDINRFLKIKENIDG